MPIGISSFNGGKYMHLNGGQECSRYYYLLLLRSSRELVFVERPDFFLAVVCIFLDQHLRVNYLTLIKLICIYLFLQYDVLHMQENMGNNTVKEIYKFAVMNDNIL